MTSWTVLIPAVGTERKLGGFVFECFLQVIQKGADKKERKGFGYDFLFFYPVMSWTMVLNPFMGLGVLGQFFKRDYLIEILDLSVLIITVINYRLLLFLSKLDN